ncbi:PQQ-dependent sugar dehydrogenase [Allonocardiopsis opalescens]|uniref:Glucose/arabinose dehydrogenase n=1 Tax=Allonocardiopsis opalescens TaxID=1144618 RepID=A0A2T0QCP7_9ACTN|nr:PQQ-dependent sugar dehydrogenase [Allonocardiopsis opalescens]PRY01724.1 glucose/arabinose dehydrogenase [Allonocardiopsis opalescens]
MKPTARPRRAGWARRLTALAVTLLIPLAGLSATAAPASAHDEALHWENYERVLLSESVGEPIDLAVMPDLRVLHTARNGDVRLTDPSTGITRVINRIPVYANSEDGLQTIALDPDFAENGWVYIYYAPPLDTPQGSAPQTLPAGEDESYWDRWLGYNQLSRFQWDEETDSLDLSTEQEIIQVEVQRGQCCHVGGDVGWDAEGNLYLATGDNTPASTPGANGFAPNNDAPNMNPGFDARRGAGSTADLRGKILRITVQEDGSYTIPEGNLFPAGEYDPEQARPEIFVMGVRNPFRMDVDPQTGGVYWGDYGPDSGVANDQRGPMGYVEWQSTSTDRPLNAGWPYCHGPNANYNEWDFATGTPGEFFDCEAGAENNSRHNTGLDVVPPATAPQLYYGDQDTHQPWPELTAFGAGTGQGPMGGPVYHYDTESDNPYRFPAYWDGKVFFSEFSQDYVAAFTQAGPNAEVTAIEDVFPRAEQLSQGLPPWENPMDIEFGPDGSLYVLEYGNGFFRENPEAGLYRIDYVEGNQSPRPSLTATPTGGPVPLEVAFDASGSTDPEGAELTYEWDFDGDGTFDATGPTASHTYTEEGLFNAILRVRDPEGRIGLASRAITPGNTAPTVTIETPPAGGFFEWGQEVPYEVTVTDPEDGDAIDCARVTWQLGLGHNNDHAHPGPTGSGCTGVFPTSTDSDHGPTENVYAAIVVRYTDSGAGDVPPATTEVSLRLLPKYREAEHAAPTSGVEVVNDDDASGFRAVTSLDPGDWIAYDDVNLTGIDGVTLAASSAAGGTVELRWNAPDGPVVGTVEVGASTGYESVSAEFTDPPTETGTLYATSTGGVDLDAFTFRGNGVVPAASAADALADLTAEFGEHVAAGHVDRATANPLSTHLSTAQRHLDRGETALAERSLRRFQEGIRGGGIADSAMAEDLYWAADQVIDGLSEQ